MPPNHNLQKKKTEYLWRQALMKRVDMTGIGRKQDFKWFLFCFVFALVVEMCADLWLDRFEGLCRRVSLCVFLLLIFCQ